MSKVLIRGFHTCKPDGGWSYVLENAPFLSGSSERQWLTQGYYFWTDNEHFAHIWGRDGYQNSYAIVYCSLAIDHDLLLDLVGSVEAQLYFQELLKKFRKKLEKSGFKDEPTVNAIIAYYRKQNKAHKGCFPYHAIKAEDYPDAGKIVRFTQHGKESMLVVKRQQLCLFEEGTDSIKEKRLIYPKDYMDESSEVAEIRAGGHDGKGIREFISTS